VSSEKRSALYQTILQVIARYRYGAVNSSGFSNPKRLPGRPSTGQLTGGYGAIEHIGGRKSCAKSATTGA
jgi:hypothetical protein